MKIIKFIFLSLLLSCSTAKKDPLEKSKSLIGNGHKSLYQNGAFEVPMINIKLIPPGPSISKGAKEILGMNVRESFLVYLNQAQKSLKVIYDGSKKTYSYSRKVDQQVENSLQLIGKMMSQQSVVVFDESKNGLEMLEGTLPFAGKVSWAIDDAMSGLMQDFLDAGDRNDDNFNKYLIELDKNQISIEMSDPLDKFISGYVSVPKKLKENVDEVSARLSLENFKKRNAAIYEFQKDVGASSASLITNSADNYFSNIKKSFSESADEITKDKEGFGSTLSSLRAFRWVLDGLLWQGVIKPVSKSTAGLLGYVAIKGVAYPVMLVSAGGMSFAEIAVEVVQETADSAYTIIAPSGELVLSAILNGGILSGQKIHKAAAQSTKVATTALIKGSGILISETTRYVGIPFAAGSVVAGGSITGVAVSVGGTAAAGAMKASGEASKLSSKIIAPVVSSSVLVGGVTAYSLIGTTQVAYEVAKSAIVPPSMVLGHGLALSYGSLVHLASHAALAVSDCAYLVLSMEGPNWVVYAVKGKLGDGSKISQKTVLNLEDMQNQGEEFYRVPVTPEEMQKMLDSNLE